MYPWPFLSQLHLNGSGDNDCFQSSLGAYLEAAGKFPPGTPQTTILNAISLATRGTPDQPGNPDTTLSEADLGLQHYGLPANLSTDWLAALGAPFAILLVDGARITKADGSKPYPASWFGNVSGSDHFVLWGPPFNGAFNWLMNPLDPSGQWAQYDLDSVRSAFNCAYLLPAIPSAKPAPTPHWMALRKFDIKTTADHLSTGLAVVPRGGTGLDWGTRRTTGGEKWGRFQFRNVVGWAPVAYVQDMA